MDDDRKKILDVTTKGWKKESIDKLAKTINSRYKYKITIKMPNGKTKWVYSNDPVITEMYLRSIGATILKVSTIGSATENS